MIPRRVQLAILLAFLCHGFFIVTARYRLSYDAYTHMLFANHYAENWFSLWESRWYTGFTVISYPPLAHQLVALFIPLMGFDAAFALILWIVTTLYPLGIYAFARIFTGKTSASYAALASAILLPIYVTAYIFGQLPFLTSTLFALFSAASLACYLRTGRFLDLALSVALVATTMASHHATLIVQPFLFAAVVIAQINRDNWRTVFTRLILFGIPAVFAELTVIWPFWEWGTHQVMQTPIDHLSRHNFIADPIALAIFFFPLYGPLIVVIPFLFRKWHPRLIGLLISFAILFLLGLGGTTPLPHLFFGKAWEWLTYDRFAFWASLTLTPFFGMLFIQFRRRWKNRHIASPTSFGQSLGKPVTLRRNFLSALIFSVFAVTALGSWFVPFFWANQPKPIAMQPIVSFLNEDDRSQWRYLTFGFGNQYTYLNLLTKATTIDGSYHTARMLPELRESGIAEVDTAYWTPEGVSALAPILQKSGEYGVRWGFVNPAIVETIKKPREIIRRSPFIPVLEQLGWVKIKTLTNGIIVYENPNAILPALTKPPPSNSMAEFSWGILPLFSLIVTLSLSALSVWHVKAKQAIYYIYSFLIALIPISLCFWFFRDVGESPHLRVYFIYTDVLFFISDALALLALILWALTHLTKETHFSAVNYKRLFQPLSFIFLLFTLCFLATISIFWSLDWLTSLYISFHFWLIFLLILSLRDWHESWKVAMFGLCVGLSLQLITGFIGYAQQSTAFLDSLNMKWPGILDPSIRGASVVQLANGSRILRAYGTLPHPNILGGFVFLTLLGPVSLFLTNKKPDYPALILFALGIMLLGLTFSRSAWLALVAFLLILVLKSKYFERKKLFLLISAIALASILTLYPLKDLVFTRVSNSTVATEQNSVLGRVWYTQQAIEIIQKHPLTGVGIGAFVLELANIAAEGVLIEPVHNIFLLATTELGIVGLLLMIGLFIVIALTIVKAKSPQAILAGATLTGLGVISLFDHYLWTLALGRIMLGLVLGLWAGQVAHDA
jgi:O-antigen ligase